MKLEWQFGSTSKYVTGILPCRKRILATHFSASSRMDPTTSMLFKYQQADDNQKDSLQTATEEIHA
jgi:hypothetical protein